MKHHLPCHHKKDWSKVKVEKSKLNNAWDKPAHHPGLWVKDRAADHIYTYRQVVGVHVIV